MTSKQIFSKLSVMIPNKKRSTKQQKEILKKTIRYDENISDHTHLFCLKCKNILDVFEYSKI